jgi:hypothetical protein
MAIHEGEYKGGKVSRTCIAVLDMNKGREWGKGCVRGKELV